jgi:hypothetical protein
VSPLAEAQAQFRAALNPGAVVPSTLIFPERLSIYRRHHVESLARHLRGRYPTVEWLLGTPRMTEAITAFVGEVPPRTPCMAEYGFEFIDFLSGQDVTRAVPYAADVAALDWHLGDVAVAIELPSLPISSLASVAAETLPDLRLTLQPGIGYVTSDWPVDELIWLRLRDDPAARPAFLRQRVSIEVRGARGSFRLARLDRAVLEFRAALLAGETIGHAVQRGVEESPGLDVPAALATLFAEGLVTGLTVPASRSAT